MTKMAFTIFSVPMRRLMTVGIAIGMTLPIAACGNKSQSQGSEKLRSVADFAQVCNNVPMDVVPAYVKNNPNRSIAFFERKNPQSTFEYNIYPKLPTAWTTNPQNFRDNQLVICVTQKSTKVTKTCDGYEVEDKSTKAKKPAKLELHDVDYEFVAYEAKTAKVLESKVLNAKVDQTCPSVVIFSKDALVTQQYAEYQQPLLEFAKSHL
jgi:hypothetical protein